MPQQNYLITTAIPYANGAPHIGHAYERIATDVMARFARLDGAGVFFVTGMDEHGQKMQQTAAREGLTPLALADRTAGQFEEMGDLLNARADDIVRTTSARHRASVQDIWKRMEANGDIYLSKYAGWYSVRDEAYYDEEEIEEREGKKYSTKSGTPVEWVEEESYFFKLSAYQQKLLDLYASWPRELQDETAFLTCLDYKEDDTVQRHGGLFTDRGLAPNIPAPDARYHPCHFTVWSGCLYRLAAVREIGLPNADYVLDWGEGEYGYRVLKAGYKGFVYSDAVFHHNVRGYVSIRPTNVDQSTAAETVYEFPAMRCYYSCRNMLYFVLYELERGRRRMFLRSLAGPVKLTLNLLMRPRNHGKHIRACIRGIWDGVTGNIAARY